MTLREDILKRALGNTHFLCLLLSHKYVKYKDVKLIGLKKLNNLSANHTCADDTDISTVVTYVSVGCICCFLVLSCLGKKG